MVINGQILDSTGEGGGGRGHWAELAAVILPGFHITENPNNLKNECSFPQ